MPDFAYCIGEISRRSTVAIENDVDVLIKVVQRARQLYKPLVLSAIEGDWMLVGSSDASYDIKTYQGRVGYQIKLVSSKCSSEEINILTWSSRVLRNKLSSTTAAELHALAKVIKAMPLYIDLVVKLTGRTPTVYEVDNKPLTVTLSEINVRTSTARTA
eukprot:GHVR01054626.1.p1 GENE.GHVR01054626.1~~GHVR01054626.1.p1  ORF type:complete len:159 (+),score=14.09 GHVR01054626.1:767-1243(+)